MKKMLTSIILLLSLLMISCLQSVEVLLPYYVAPGTKNELGQSAITFSTYGSGNARLMTRAVANSASGTGYDDFSLYVWTKDSTVINNWHTTWAGAGWTYVNVESGQYLKYFDNFVDKYNFIGIIPQTTNYLSNSSVTTAVSGFITDDETNTPKEFLYATTSVLKAEYNKGATMNFLHGNAKIYLKFTSNDENTQIIDYYPGQAGYNIYTMTATTVPTLGPLLTAINISDEDIEFINSRYTASKGFSSYQSSNVINGSLDENMWEYLINKYPTLSSISLGNWGSYISNPNMRLVHIDKTGHTSVDNDSYRAVWVNVQSVNWSSYTVSGSTGVDDIIVLPAKSVLGNGSDAILASYPTNANVNVSLDGLNWAITGTNNTITYTKPVTNIISNNVNLPVPSPSAWYTLPCNEPTIGYTVKLSYIYKGTAVYDARVFIPASECLWQPGKYYTYIIQINGRGNGHSEPNNKEADDPVVSAVELNNELKLFLVEFTPYSDGGTIIKEIQ